MLLSTTLLAWALQAPATPDAALAALDHAALTASMNELATGHPGLVQRVVLGTSREGREIGALRIALGDPAGRPAVLVVANIDGPQTFSSALALEHARRLCSDGAVRELLEDTTFWIVPRANPDGAEARFQAPLMERRNTGFGVDDDRDARNGEDAPADVDGDGVIAWMRWRDPEGTLVPDPADERALDEADRLRGETGGWRVAREAFDADGDGEVGEDAPRDADVNRNFPAFFEEHTARAGRFPTDEPEARALCDFVLQHPEIALVLCYGELSNLAAEPKSVADDAPDTKRIPPRGLLESDAKLVKALGEKYRELVSEPALDAGLGDDGTFQAWAYDHRGLFVLAARPWALPLDAEPPKADAEPGDAAEDAAQAGTADEDADDGKGERKAPERRVSDEAKRLRWIDAHDQGERFLAWKAFEHPTLGAVEIGGFAPYADVDPPAQDAARIADEHHAFLLAVAANVPRLEFESVTAREEGSGLLRVKAVLRNTGFLPYATRAALRSRTIRPARVELALPTGARRLGGPELVLVDELAGSGGRREFEWLVLGAAASDVRVSFESDHAGHAEAVPELAR